MKRYKLYYRLADLLAMFAHRLYERGDYLLATDEKEIERITQEFLETHDQDEFPFEIDFEPDFVDELPDWDDIEDYTSKGYVKGEPQEDGSMLFEYNPALAKEHLIQYLKKTEQYERLAELKRKGDIK